MKEHGKLPITEFEIMKVVWANNPPITTNIVMDQLGNSKGWKAPTAIALMLRLVERGYLSTEKKNKERLYYPLTSRDEYLRFETEYFMRLYHENSFSSLFNSILNGEGMEEKDLDEMVSIITSSAGVS